MPYIDNLPPLGYPGGGFHAEVATDGDGVKFVTSSTQNVCQVGSDGLAVSFVGVGLCQLTAHVSAGQTYIQADGTPQGINIWYLTPTQPNITNLPTNALVGQSFLATVSTNSGGFTYVTSGTPAVCSVPPLGSTVTFVSTGMCTLTAQVNGTADYLSGEGIPQSFSVRTMPTTPSITNIPMTGAVYDGSFTATVSTNGDGIIWVTSSTSSVCNVEADGFTVDFVGVGLCSLQAHVSAGTSYAAADGITQSFTVGPATPTTPIISNLPTVGLVGTPFVAIVATNSNGVPSVTSSTPKVCTVGPDQLTVTFSHAGTCSLTAGVAATTEYLAASGSVQSFTVKLKTKK